MVWPSIKELIITHINNKSVDVNIDESVELTSLLSNEYINTSHIILLEAAVMIEAKFYELVDLLLVSHTNPEIAVSRIVSRNNVTMDVAQQRLNAQISNTERLMYAHIPVENNSDMNIYNDNITSKWLGLLDQLKDYVANHCTIPNTHYLHIQQVSEFKLLLQK